MKTKVLLGIDIGTTNVKVAAIDSSGAIIGMESRSTALNKLRENWIEQDPESWWTNAVLCIVKLLDGRGIGKGDVAGIAVSGQGTGATFVDEEGKPLNDCLIWMDRRSEEIAKRNADFKSRVFDISGNELDPVYNTLAAAWFRENRPELFARTRKMLTATEYILFKLSGVFAGNRSDCGNEMSYDARRGAWSEEIMSHFGLGCDLLTTIYECTDVVGGLTSEAAAATGLRSGMPVVAGGEDTSSAAFAMGVIHPNQAYYSTGTSTNLGICIKDDAAEFRGIRNIMTLPHVVAGYRLESGNITTAGSCVDWLRREVYKESRGDIHALIDKEVAAAGKGNLLFLPFLAGTFSPESDSNARGAFVGISLDTTRAQMAQAVMEGVSFEVRHHIENFKEYGYSIAEFRCAGGPTKSAVWNQITSDIAGVRLAVIDSISDASIGDAMLAGIGTGCFSGYEDAVSKTVKVGAEVKPSEEKAAAYAARYAVYRDVYRALSCHFDRIIAQ